eukprot:g4087.t1
MNALVNRSSLSIRIDRTANRAPFTLKQKHGRLNKHWKCRAQQEKFNSLIDAGPNLDPVDYTDFDNFPLNRFLMSIFRRSLCNVTGGLDSETPGFQGVMELIRTLNDPRHNSPEETREKATEVLRSLFPSWFTEIIKVCISQPFPEFSARLNAWATSKTCTWLMGSLVLNDVEFEDGTMGKGQGVLVERCRFLEESSCASICHNSCKLPTQAFFKKEMGLDVTLEPNYEDFSCQFCFGKTPLPLDEDPVLQTPCFVQCPTKKRYSPTCSNNR